MGNLPEAHLTIAGFGAIANPARATSAREKLAEEIGVEAVVELSPFCFSRAFRQTRLEENIGAVELELTKDDLREIDEAASEIESKAHVIRKSSKRWDDDSVGRI